MKPTHLTIEGFLSYQNKVEIDFTQFELACITGENGSGKSSILDAMTWVLFGKARQSNESLINLQSDEATINFSFEYGGESYKIKRSNARGKPARLTLKTPEVDLTERTTRDTQNKIEQILKIDYDTFVNAVFFLQGGSDQFVTASPGQRKQVLFDILGLAAWEEYRLKAAAKIKGIEKQMEQSRGSMQMLEEDIQGEHSLMSELALVNQGVRVASGNEVVAKNALVDEKEIFDEFTTWKEGLAELRQSFTGAAERVTGLTNRKTLLDTQQVENQALTSRKSQIVKDYERYQEISILITQMDMKSAEWNLLNNELTVLEQQLKSAEDELAKIPELEVNIEEGQKHLELATELTEQIEALQKEHIDYSAEVRRFAGIRDEKREQLEDLEGHDICPLCEQKLKDPQMLIRRIKTEVEVIETERHEVLRKTNQTLAKIAEVQSQLNGHSEHGKQVSDAKQLIGQIQQRAAEIDRDRIGAIQENIAALDYDSGKVAYLKEEQTALRNAPRDHGLLEGAEKIGDSLTVQIKGLEQDIFDTEATVLEYQNQLESKKDKYTGAYEQERLAAVKLYTENLEKAKADYDREMKREGQIEAQIQTIEKQKVRLEEIKEKEKETILLHQKYCQLQEAFSKKGVPALLVEQSLPQIESKANELLYRLSNGQMSVHFITQRAYADGSRDDMKETLDIEIQDQAGIRDYELYSGGESFRINFAIRMALSYVLANRANAKLRTLVIDEGLSSQDAAGRDRLLNAINVIKKDYDKVLIISHVSEIIESFPTRLHVEKTSTGSKVRMM